MSLKSIASQALRIFGRSSGSKYTTHGQTHRSPAGAGSTKASTAESAVKKVATTIRKR